MKENHRLIISNSAKQRVISERKKQHNENLNLRIIVEGGGCSGFKYIFDWDDNINKDEDIIFDNVVVTDNLSLEIIQNSEIDYVSGIMGSDFKIKNPNAKSGCGCGESFSI